MSLLIVCACVPAAYVLSRPVMNTLNKIGIY